MAESDGARRQAIPAGLPYYLLAAVLLAGFIESFAAWQALSTRFGGSGAGLFPPALLAFLLAVLGGWGVVRFRRGKMPKATPLIAGIVLSVGALALSDPAFPAKRIHVAEYILLSLVLGKGLRFHVAGKTLTGSIIIVTLLFGIHDELIQGLHPDRTFGLRDIAVNGVSGIAGAFIASGLRLFEGAAPIGGGRRLAVPWAAALVAVGAALLLAALPWLRDGPVPWWTMTPLLAGGFAWFLLQSDGPTHAAGHPLPLSIWLALSTAIYPAIANATPLVFH